MADEVVVLVAALIGAISAIAGSMFGSQLLNKAEDRRMRIQLYHEDQQRAMRSLFQLVSSKEKDPDEWMSRISHFLDSLDGALLPDGLRKEMIKQFYDFGEYEHEHLPHKYPGLSDKEAEHIVKDFDQDLQKMNVSEREEFLFEGHVEAVRHEMQDRIESYAAGKSETKTSDEPRPRENSTLMKRTERVDSVFKVMLVVSSLFLSLIQVSPGLAHWSLWDLVAFTSLATGTWVIGYIMTDSVYATTVKLAAWMIWANLFTILIIFSQWPSFLGWAGPSAARSVTGMTLAAVMFLTWVAFNGASLYPRSGVREWRLWFPLIIGLIISASMSMVLVY